MPSGPGEPSPRRRQQPDPIRIEVEQVLPETRNDGNQFVKCELEVEACQDRC